MGRRVGKPGGWKGGGLDWRCALLSGLGVFGVAHGAVLYGSLRRNSGWFGPLVRGFETAGKEVWLTIDDGPEPRDTPGMLDVLAEHGARATFFFVGRKAERERDLVWRARREGHGIGNHTYSHPAGAFWTLPPGMMAREIRRGADALEAASGVRPTLFRSPVGMTNPFVHPVLRREGAALVGWSVSGVDGLGDRGEVVVRRIVAGLRPGGIAVLHEGGAPGRVETLRMLLEELGRLGWRCVVPEIGRVIFHAEHRSLGRLGAAPGSAGPEGRDERERARQAQRRRGDEIR